MPSPALKPLSPPVSRAVVLDRLYRRLGTLDDLTLAQLEQLLAGNDPIEFVEALPPETVSPQSGGRRRFLLALLTGSIVVAGSGLATTIITGTRNQPASTSAPVGPSLTLRELPANSDQPAELTRVVADLQSALSQTRNDLLAAQAELSTLRAAEQQLEAALQARDAAESHMREVIRLYKALEAINLDGLVADGLTPLEAALLALVGTRALLESGIRQAAAALAGIELQAPAIADGLRWLEEQIAALAETLQRLEDALSTIFEPVQPITQQITAFVDRVLTLLPFGVGDNIRAGLEAIGAILTHIPELVASINPLFITPLREWISPDDESGGLVGNVVTPISQNLITPAQRAADQSRDLESTFAQHVKTPLEAALTARAAIRAELMALEEV
ncbi:MAG: hypothetical protein Kow0077_05250 [Anaerolineae bacterium]